MIGGLVLAAGSGSRLGGHKQLVDLGGRPLLEHAVRAMSRAPLDRVCVVLGSDAPAVLDRVDLGGADAVVCERWGEGQSASLRTGLEALADCTAVVVALGDQPFVSPRAVERVLAARGGGADAVRATFAGEPGHPVVLERHLFGRLARLRGDVGARAVLDDARVVDVPCDGLGRADDLDTPEQLEQARRALDAPRDPFEEAIRR